MSWPKWSNVLRSKDIFPGKGGAENAQPSSKNFPRYHRCEKKSFKSIRPKTGMALSFLPRCCLVAVRLFSTDFRLVIEK